MCGTCVGCVLDTDPTSEGTDFDELLGTNTPYILPVYLYIIFHYRFYNDCRHFRRSLQQFVEVRARVEGYLENMLFAEGTYVNKNQVLFVRLSAFPAQPSEVGSVSNTHPTQVPHI